jgi:hypothetical protein
VSFAAITLCVASQRVFIALVVVYFVIDSVRKLLDTPSHISYCPLITILDLIYDSTDSRYLLQWMLLFLYDLVRI